MKWRVIGYLHTQLRIRSTGFMVNLGSLSGLRTTVLYSLYNQLGHVTEYNNNVHLSCAHQRPERSHDTY